MTPVPQSQLFNTDIECPQVSVIIPCYNAERFLAETLDSVLAQTYRDYEVIAIDDGSTDRTPHILRAYETRFAGKLRWESTPNRGASAARNRGTELATGVYLQYLDADDLLRPAALAGRVRAMQQHDADVIYAGHQNLVEDETGRFLPGEIYSRKLEDLHPQRGIALLLAFLPLPSTILYHRRIVELIGGWDENLSPAEDSCFMFEADYYGGKFVHLPEVDIDYRIAFGNISQSRRNPWASLYNWFKFALKAEQHWFDDSSLDDEKIGVLINIYASSLSALYEYDRPLFWQTYAKIRDRDPDFMPVKTRSMIVATRLFGYPRAEALALAVRRLRRCLGNWRKGS